MIKLKFILASSSPRRIELLKSVNLNFKVIHPEIKEEMIKEKNPEKLVKILAFEKALSIAKNHKNNFVAGFDTIVELNNTILGKPKTEEEAFEMLKKLSGNIHNVITGMSFINISKKIFIKKSNSTKVWFKKLTNREIEWYIKTKEPMDKAGAYAIQGKGAFMVKKIEGSYTNVVGLPLTEFLEILHQFENKNE